VSEYPFYVTQMGRTFYEHTVPEIVFQLSLLNDNIERLAEAVEHSQKPTHGDQSNDPDEDKEKKSTHP